MDNTLGEEIWNFPIYSYSSTAKKLDARHVEVRTNILYTNMTDMEYDKAPANSQTMAFHYQLELDGKGNIIGGQTYRDSNQLDLIWIALHPTQGGTAGNEEGSRYLSCRQVLALWRASAPEAARKTWYNIDPIAEDRIPSSKEDVAPAQAPAAKVAKKEAEKEEVETTADGSAAE